MSTTAWFLLGLALVGLTGYVLHRFTGNRQRLALIPLAGVAICVIGGWAAIDSRPIVRTLPDLGTACSGSLIVGTESKQEMDRVSEKFDWLSGSINAQTGCGLGGKIFNVNDQRYTPPDCLEHPGWDCWTEQSIVRQLEIESEYKDK
jgi:hypothetical protein